MTERESLTGQLQAENTRYQQELQQGMTGPDRIAEYRRITDEHWNRVTKLLAPLVQDPLLSPE